MITQELHDNVTVLKMHHGRANAMDLELLQGLTREVREAADQDRALVLTGTNQMFSAGIDLPKLLSNGSEYTYELVDALDRMLETFMGLARPVVAAINGHAIAGGFVLASACDVRLMATGPSRVGLTELLVGVPFPPLALEVVRLAVGDENARRMVLQGRLYSDQDAAAEGLVDELVEPETLLERSVERADAMGRVSGRAFRLTKEQLLLPLRMRLESLRDGHGPEVRQTWVADETLQVIRRFVQDRLG